jgi:3-oxoadipate enol-lactonase
VWADLAGRLATRYDVIAVDVRGHGGSTWDGTPFSISDLAGDVAAILDALGLRSAHLLGMSMGGSIAMTFAGMYPERVERLVLADTTAWYGADAGEVWEERARRALLVPRVRQVPFQVDRWFTDALRAKEPAKVHGVVSTFLSTSSRVHAEASRAMGALDARDLLPSVTAPTLVLTGVQDYATPPEMGHYVGAHVQQGRAITLPGLRHLSLIERPELAELVAAHLDGASQLPDVTAPSVSPCACADRMPRLAEDHA